MNINLLKSKIKQFKAKLIFFFKKIFSELTKKIKTSTIISNTTSFLEKIVLFFVCHSKRCSDFSAMSFKNIYLTSLTVKNNLIYFLSKINYQDNKNFLLLKIKNGIDFVKSKINFCPWECEHFENNFFFSFFFLLIMCLNFFFMKKFENTIFLDIKNQITKPIENRNYNLATKVATRFEAQNLKIDNNTLKFNGNLFYTFDVGTESLDFLAKFYIPEFCGKLKKKKARAIFLNQGKLVSNFNVVGESCLQVEEKFYPFSYAFYEILFVNKILLPQVSTFILDETPFVAGNCEQFSFDSTYSFARNIFDQPAVGFVLFLKQDQSIAYLLIMLLFFGLFFQQYLFNIFNFAFKKFLMLKITLFAFFVALLFIPHFSEISNALFWSKLIYFLIIFSCCSSYFFFQFTEKMSVSRKNTFLNLFFGAGTIFFWILLLMRII